MPDVQVMPEPSENAVREMGNKARESNNFGIQFVDNSGWKASIEQKYNIYIYNLSNRTFELHRPPDFPLIIVGPSRNGKPSQTIPGIVIENWVDSNNGEIRDTLIKGERFATDLLNPTNTTNDIWLDISKSATMASTSDDLTRRGCFWSRFNPAKPAEIEESTKRMEGFYRELLKGADVLAQSKVTVQEINLEHHIAADYFGYKASWHMVAEVPKACVNCGEPLRGNLAFHTTNSGAICVLDWKRTVAAGVKKMEDVPEGCRW